MPPPKRPTPGQRKFDKYFFVNLWDWCKTHDLSGDLNTVMVSRCWGSGTTVKSRASQAVNQSGVSGSSGYAGYFTVIKSGTGKVKVVNGADEAATVCGSFTAGSSNVSCTATELTVSGAGVVYIRIYKSGSTYRYEFAFAATLPSVVREIYKPLASTNADGVPAQVWTGGAITDINGSYVA